MARLHAAWAKFAASPWRRAVEIAILVLSLGLMGRALVSSLSQIDFATLRFDVASLLAALLLTWITVWIGAFAWAEIVRALHHEVPYLTAIKYHLFSGTTKYLPGFGWQQISKAVQLHRGGVPARQTAAAVALEVGLVMLTGLATAMLVLSLTPRTIFGLVLAPGLLVGFIALLWAACITGPLLLSKFAGRRILVLRVRKGFVLHLWLAELLLVGAWLTFGTALWFTCRILVPLPLDTLPYCIVVLIISVLVSLAIIIVPNGFGVRELTMSTLLQVILPLPLSIMTAVMSRIVLIAAEFLGVLPFVMGILLTELKNTSVLCITGRRK